MTDKAVQLEEALSLVLSLSPVDRLKLVERVVSSVERELEVAPLAEQQPEAHWGQALNRLLDEVGPIDLVDPEIEDPVEWVKAQREKQRQQRLGDWGQ
ncbi:MAG: hypothetical protein ACYDBJ_08915 [Aggregatilineales bacterium]